MSLPRTIMASVVLVLSLFLAASSVHAFWIWTPESGKWINPKYDAKPSPQEQLNYADGFFAARRYAGRSS